MEEPNDAPEVIETPEETLEAPEAEAPAAEEAEAEAETLDDRDQRIADLEDKNKKLFARAKKAEEDAKRSPATAAPEGQLSTADVLAFAKADIDEEDTDRVVKFAKDEGITVREALKSEELKAIIAVRREKRTTAQAANVSSVRRGPVKMTDDTLVSNAEKGKLPDDDEGISRLVSAMNKRSK